MFEEKVVWKQGKWKRRDYATIMSGRVVRYTVGYGPGETEISASRDGVMVSNLAILTEEQYVETLGILRRAMLQHSYLKKADGNNPLPEEEGVAA